MKKYLLVLLALFLSSSSAAQISCPPLPTWAIGYAAGTCDIIVDAGAGYGPQTFKVPLRDKTVGGQFDIDNCPSKLDTTNGCPVCNQLLFNSTVDGYLGNKNNDVVHIDQFANPKFLFVKNFTAMNGMACEGGTWTNPVTGGVSCASTDITTAHVDVFSLLTIVNDNGWIAIQDSKIINAQHQLSDQWTADGFKGGYVSTSPNGACTDSNGPEGILLQRVKIGNDKNPTGNGHGGSYPADCKARGGAAFACDSGNQIAIIEGQNGKRWKAAWLVNVDNISGVYFRVWGQVDELIVIGGSGGSNGWPGPLGPGQAAWKGIACPNGQLVGANYAEKDTTVKVFCYDSIEKALADGHKKPPFIQLSTAGWASTPVPPTPVPTVINNIRLINTDTQAVISSNISTNGTIIDIHNTPNFAFDVIGAGTFTKVRFVWDSDTSSASIEQKAPYSCNDNGTIFTPCTTHNSLGFHSLSIQLQDATGNTLASAVRTYTIVDSTPIIPPCPTGQCRVDNPITQKECNDAFPQTCPIPTPCPVCEICPVCPLPANANTCKPFIPTRARIRVQTLDGGYIEMEGQIVQ